MTWKVIEIIPKVAVVGTESWPLSSHTSRFTCVRQGPKHLVRCKIATPVAVIHKEGILCVQEELMQALELVEWTAASVIAVAHPARTSFAFVFNLIWCDCAMHCVTIQDGPWISKQREPVAGCLHLIIWAQRDKQIEPSHCQGSLQFEIVDLNASVSVYCCEPSPKLRHGRVLCGTTKRRKLLAFEWGLWLLYFFRLVLSTKQQVDLAFYVPADYCTRRCWTRFAASDAKSEN